MLPGEEEQIRLEHLPAQLEISDQTGRSVTVTQDDLHKYQEEDGKHLGGQYQNYNSKTHYKY